MRRNVAAAIILWVIVYIWSPCMNMNVVLHVLEKSPNLKSVTGVERLIGTFSAPLLEHDSYSNNLLQPPAKLMWKRGTSSTHLNLPSAVVWKQHKGDKKERWITERALQCLTMPRRRLQMAGFIEGCHLNMFSGSFQCNFLPLSMGTQPVRGQNEA